MDEQEVWVRMMAAGMASVSTSIGRPRKVSVAERAEDADAAVAEWRKRYGAKAEPAPAPFKVGDRVRLPNGTPATVVNLSLDHGVLTERRDPHMNTREWFRPSALILSPKQESPCDR